MSGDLFVSGLSERGDLLSTPVSEDRDILSPAPGERSTSPVSREGDLDLSLSPRPSVESRCPD